MHYLDYYEAIVNANEPNIFHFHGVSLEWHIMLGYEDMFLAVKFNYLGFVFFCTDDD